MDDYLTQTLKPEGPGKHITRPEKTKLLTRILCLAKLSTKVKG